MNINSNGYVMGFAVGVCVVISAALAVTANALRPAQLAAEKFDKQKTVMIAAGLIQLGDPRPRAELEELYQKRVQERVLDCATGKFVDALSGPELEAAQRHLGGSFVVPKTPDDLDRSQAPDRDKWLRTVAVALQQDGKTADAYVLPIFGKGLWSDLYGYLAVEADGARVRGITFYKHGETPGLGGEVENPGFVSLAKPMSAVQAVLERGGFGRGADMTKVTIISHVEGKSVVRELNLRRDDKEGVPIEESLNPDDVVFVPKTGIAAANAWVEQWIDGLTPQMFKSVRFPSL